MSINFLQQFATISIDNDSNKDIVTFSDNFQNLSIDDNQNDSTEKQKTENKQKHQKFIRPHPLRMNGKIYAKLKL